MHAIHVISSSQGDWAFGWTALAAIGTLALAAVTVWLAWSTRKLADASTADQRQQWRPVLAAGADNGNVTYDEDTGELEFDIRNVGRGPAFGVHAELRSGANPCGASLPGEPPSALAPGEAFRLRTLISDPSKRAAGKIIQAEISYYDVTEYWHKSHLTIAWRRERRHTPRGFVVSEDDPLEPAVAKAFFEQTGNRLLPVTGSPRALAEAEAAADGASGVTTKLRRVADALGRWLIKQAER